MFYNKLAYCSDYLLQRSPVEAMITSSNTKYRNNINLCYAHSLLKLKDNYHTSRTYIYIYIYIYIYTCRLEIYKYMVDLLSFCEYFLTDRLVKHNLEKYSKYTNEIMEQEYIS